jgi:hypothetical protein
LKVNLDGFLRTEAGAREEYVDAPVIRPDLREQPVQVIAIGNIPLHRRHAAADRPDCFV